MFTSGRLLADIVRGANEPPTALLRRLSGTTAEDDCILSAYWCSRCWEACVRVE